MFTKMKKKDINEFMGMEFATFRLKKGFTEEQLFQSVDQMVTGLYANEDCFLGHSLLKGDNDMYVDVVFATSKEAAKYLCGKWGQGPFAEDCLSYLEKIEESSANMAFFERLI